MSFASSNVTFITRKLAQTDRRSENMLVLKLPHTCSITLSQTAQDVWPVWPQETKLGSVSLALSCSKRRNPALLGHDDQRYYICRPGSPSGRKLFSIFFSSYRGPCCSLLFGRKKTHWGCFVRDWILTSCQSHTVTSERSNTVHQSLHILQLDLHLRQTVARSHSQTQSKHKMHNTTTPRQ